MNALTKIESTALSAMTETELIEVLQSSLYPGASLGSIKMVLGYCKAAGLDPMKKPVHIVPMWDSKSKSMRDVIMPGVGNYRTDAARTGEYAGITEPEFGPDTTENLSGTAITFPLWCRVTVRRRAAAGAVAEFTAREFWKENYATAGKDTSAPNAMWKKRPYAQLAKCAEAQALRKAFPEAGAQPTADEMEGKALDEQPAERHMGAAEVVTPEEPVTWPQDAFDKKLPTFRKAIAEGKSADDIVAWAKTKGALTAEQEKAIREPAKTAKPAADADGVIVMSYAQVADKLNAAKDLDKLAEAASLISTVGNEGQRKELNALYEARGAELQN